MRLAIDTSGIDQAMVVLDGRRVLAAEDWVRRRDDQPVLARLEALVERAGGRPDDLDAVAAARGPGSFTGLRVGLALAAGLAYARHIPLYLVDSMAILARRANGDPATVALRDAGRAEVFAWREGEPVRRMPAAELVSWLPNSARVITEPAGMLATWSSTQAQLEIPQADSRRLSAALADSAIWTFESQKPLRYDEVQALYVQPAAAEERAKEGPMMQLKSRVLVDAMREDDIPQVQAIEREIFPTPWPRNAYYRELHHNRSAYYLVLRRDEDIVGYAGLWKMSDEAHITTVGVRASQQGKGYGHALMAALIQRAYQLGSRWLTLEVRPSNEVAVRLYEKFGFKVIGRRRGYYTDNNEDAIVMWSDSIQSPTFKKRFKDIMQTLEIEGLDSSTPQ